MSNHTVQEGRIRDIIFGTPPGYEKLSLAPSIFLLIDLRRKSHVLKLNSRTTRLLLKAYGTRLSFWLGKSIMYAQDKKCIWPMKH